MIKKLLSIGKKQLIVVGVIVAIAAGGLTSALSQPEQTGADTSPLTQEVDRQGKELENHDARITNNEKDVKALQDNTGTAPASDRVSVPEVPNTTPTLTSIPPAPSPTPAPVATPPPVKVVNAEKRLNLGSPSVATCLLTYSDGTTHEIPALVNTDCLQYLGQVKS